MPHIFDNKELLIYPESQTPEKTKICVISALLSVFSPESTFLSELEDPTCSVVWVKVASLYVTTGTHMTG